MTEKIVARGFHKFFNINERPETKMETLKDPDLYPIYPVLKENGFLGILSVYEDIDGEGLKWWISSKTTPSGTHADIFKNLITPFLNNEVKLKIYENNISLMFEVIDPINDPHIVKYDKEKLTLIGAVKNELEFKIFPEMELYKIYELFTKFTENDIEMDYVKLGKPINDFNELQKNIFEIYDNQSMLDDDGIEGFVFYSFSEKKGFSNESPFMFKYKTPWYKFWKFMRTIKDNIGKKIQPIFQHDISEDEKKLKLKSVLPEFKKRLFTFEENVFFNFLITRIQQKPNENLIDISIIQLRDEFLKVIGE